MFSFRSHNQRDRSQDQSLSAHGGEEAADPSAGLEGAGVRLRPLLLYHVPVFRKKLSGCMVIAQ